MMEALFALLMADPVTQCPAWSKCVNRQTVKQIVGDDACSDPKE
jgi:hypothetical protein